MATCSCLKSCSIIVAVANISLGLYIFVEGIFVFNEYFQDLGIPVGLIIVYFQMSAYLLFCGILLLIGIIKLKERHISLYLILGSLIWFIITMLVVSYMLFYNTTAMTHYLTSNVNETITTTPPSPTTIPVPKEAVPLEKAVGFSIGLTLIWCGQLGVYKFHDSVIEKNVINAGESYVSSAMNN